MKKTIIAGFLCTMLMVLPQAFAADVSEYLAKAEFDKGIQEFTQICAKNDASNEDKFSLGLLLFLDGVEGLIQDFYKFGLNSSTSIKREIPFLRLPVPPNENPEKVSQKTIHEAFLRFNKSMYAVHTALEDLNDTEIKLSIDLSAIKIDFNADGKLEKHENFHVIYSAYNRNSARLFKDNKSVPVEFNLGDVYWLKGYSHLLQALSDTLLAYEWEQVYEMTSHLFFPKVDSKRSSLFNDNYYGQYADLIAGIHVMNMSVSDPARLKSAHKNFLEVIACSRLSWKYIESETDNVNEWIPNAQQKGITGAQIDQNLITGWKTFLNEFEAILQGKKLIPHWLIVDDHGINLKRVFLEPRPFDLLLWVQGSAALPYLEKGEISTKETWDRIMRVFGGEFMGFAIWIN